MAWVTFVAHRQEGWVGMVGPDIGRLHTVVAILAVGYCMAGQIPHKVHFPQPTAWVFDEPIPRVKFPNQGKGVLY